MTHHELRARERCTAYHCWIAGRQGRYHFSTQVGLALHAEHNRPRVSYLLESVALKKHVIGGDFVQQFSLKSTRVVRALHPRVGHVKLQRERMIKSRVMIFQ